MDAALHRYGSPARHALTWLAEVFAWLRPNDLIWNYWVNNYLTGNKPPAFDPAWTGSVALADRGQRCPQAGSLLRRFGGVR